jgi:hypothetical protein
VVRTGRNRTAVQPTVNCRSGGVKPWALKIP